MAQVGLFKKQVEYQDKDGNDKTATNFFVQCGDVMIPVEVKYFENKETGKDDRYRERKVLMSAFAEELPEKENNRNRKLEKSKPKPEVEANGVVHDGKDPF